MNVAGRKSVLRGHLVPISKLILLGALACALPAGPSHAADQLAVTLTYLSREEPPLEPLSLVEPILTDEGLMGARQALGDNQTTGRFLGHSYELVERIVPEDGDLGAAFDEALAAGERLFVSDLRKDDLLALAEKADGAGALIFNSRAEDDELRTSDCFVSILHTAPSRAMLADALAQYLALKQWTRWLLVHGSHPEDKALAAAYERAAARFGAEIVETREYEDTGGARRTDSGHVQVQQQLPVFTQDAPDYDVLVVADENEVFGDYMPYRTWDPRPVVGTTGLVPTSWSRVQEQWGGTQLQRRFERFAGRPMTDRDFNAWLAVRSIGEAVTRAQSNDPKTLHDYLMSEQFEIAAFKGDPLNFRRWDQQMRAPIILVTPRVLVSVSPQEQFLHQRTPLDSLGYDQPESECRLNG
jgi:ABC transporter substrate binding protein (PQQ-dependent alcohol dehydrogenase system)